MNCESRASHPRCHHHIYATFFTKADHDVDDDDKTSEHFTCLFVLNFYFLFISSNYFELARQRLEKNWDSSNVMHSARSHAMAVLRGINKMNNIGNDGKHARTKQLILFVSHWLFAGACYSHAAEEKKSRLSMMMTFPSGYTCGVIDKWLFRIVVTSRFQSCCQHHRIFNTFNTKQNSILCSLWLPLHLFFRLDTCVYSTFATDFGSSTIKPHIQNKSFRQFVVHAPIQHAECHTNLPIWWFSSFSLLFLLFIIILRRIVRSVGT